MIDTTTAFLPSQTGVDAADQAEGTSPGRSRLLILGVAGAVLAVFAIAALLLFFTGSGDEAAAPVKRSPRVSASTPKPPSVQPSPLPAAFTGKPGRNPFRSLVTPQPTEQPSAPAGGLPLTGGTLPTAPVVGQPPAPVAPLPPVPVAPLPPAPVAPPPATAAPKPSASAPAPVAVRLASVAADNRSAVLTVNSQRYVVRIGDIFATHFKFVRAEQGRFATIQYGDVSVDLEEGRSATFS